MPRTTRSGSDGRERRKQGPTGSKAVHGQWQPPDRCRAGCSGQRQCRRQGRQAHRRRTAARPRES
eukprot:14756-Eustigmatos_ZCMA.PRE.1